MTNEEIIAAISDIKSATSYIDAVVDQVVAALGGEAAPAAAAQTQPEPQPQLKLEDVRAVLAHYDADMEAHAEGYAAFVMEQVEATKLSCGDPVVLVEQRVDFSRWMPEGFGTADCIVVADGTLTVIDFKYGLGVLVSAEGNEQMRCYALGALELFGGIYDIESVRTTIYQPRRDNLSTCEVAVADLLAWAEATLKPAAVLAFADDDEAVVQAVAAAGFDPYERRLLGITAMQCLLGKRRFNEVLDGLVEKPQGKPMLVPESDKRPPMGDAKTDFIAK